MTVGIPLPQEYTRLGLGMFVCFGLVTYTGLEQGNPNSSPNLFNPSGLSIDNWISAAQTLGAKYIVLTAVHTDGFCLWPSATSTYSIAAASPWYANSGHLDIVGSFVSKCNAAGIKPVLYCTIANATEQQLQGKSISQFITYNPAQLATLQSDYNQAQYLTYVQGLITELLNYNPYGIWFDAGYWACANTYYPWASAAAMLSFIHGLKPNVIVINNSHAAVLTDTDVMGWEGGGSGNPPGANNGPQEFCDTLQANNAWFWHGDVALQSTASIVANFQKCNQNNCSYLLDCPPNSAGVIPAAYLTAMQKIGAAL